MLKLILNYWWLFFIFAFLGWVLEVAYAAVKSRRFVNRGFDNGPVCPIYGVGIVTVTQILRPFTDHLLLLFCASVLLTTVLELLTGFLMDKLLHNKWWDYSAEKFNLGGYVCLRFSLTWGALCTVIVRWIVPLFETVIDKIPNLVGLILLPIMSIVLLLDLILSIFAAHGMNKLLGRLEIAAGDFAGGLHEGSDRIGEKVYRGTIAASSVFDNISVRALNGVKRFVDAFPTMKSEKYNEQLGVLRKKIAETREKNDARVASDLEKDRLAEENEGEEKP